MLQTTLKITLLLGLGCYLSACTTQKDPQQAIVEVTEDTFKLLPLDTSQSVQMGPEPDSFEFMDPFAITFNGAHGRILNQRVFEKLYASPDSTAPSDNSCGLYFEWPGDEIWYKGFSSYTKHKDTLAIEEFYFRPGDYMEYQGKRYDRNSTLDDFRQLFPYSCKFVYEKKKGDYRPVWAKTGVIERIFLREDPISDGGIWLYFEDKQLRCIAFIFPC